MHAMVAWQPRLDIDFAETSDTAPTRRITAASGKCATHTYIQIYCKNIINETTKNEIKTCNHENEIIRQLCEASLCFTQMELATNK